MHRFTIHIAVAALFVGPFPLRAAPAPRTVGFMGVLTDPSGKHKNGDFSATLALYDVPAGGTALWSEGQTVHVTNGLFTAALGSVTPFPSSVDFSTAYYVGITVGTDVEMQPRVPLQGVPYALFAQNVANDPSLLNKVSGGAMSTNGVNVGIGPDAPAYRLSLGGDNGNTKLALWDGGATAMGLGVGTGQFRLHLPNSSNRFSFLDAPDGNELMTIEGTGSVGIGTISPVAKLDVAGSERLGSGSELLFTDNGQIRSKDDNHRLLFRRSENKMELREFGDILLSAGASAGQETDTLVVKGGGSVGIGTTSPAAKLDVRGGIAMDNGAVLASGSLENLRIVRGTVNFNGDIIVGSGFTVTHVGTGQYTVNFSPAFAHPPTVTAGALTANGNKPYVVTMNNVWSASSVTLYTSDIQADFAAGKNGNYNDQPFNIIAVGPR